MKWFIGLLISIVFFSVGHIGGAEGNNKEPFINQELALQIGELILDNKYGEYMKTQKPLEIISLDSAWLISGNRPHSGFSQIAYIIIDKRNCKLIKMGIK